MKQYICRECEKEEIGQNTCILKTRIPPVGCTAVSQTGEQAENAPMSNWLLYNGQATLQTFAEPEPEEAPTDAEDRVPCGGPEVGACKDCDEQPQCPDINPVCNGCDDFDTCESHDPKIKNCAGKCIRPCSCCDNEDICKTQKYHRIPDECLNCEATDHCKTHDPRAGCITVALEKQPAAKKTRTPKKSKKPAEEKQAAAQPHCCDTCIGGYSNPDVITMDCPDYPDVSNGTIDQEQLRATTRRLGCTFWAAPGTPPKIPNWAWCVGTRGCPCISSVDGVCTKTGQKIKDMTYCPTQHIAEKPPKHQPSAGTGGGPLPGEFSCGTCGHHKSRKTFHESCPRLGELLFKGGTKSAKVLMDETAGNHPCLFWISKDVDRFGPCPEKNSMGTCMHGAYSCPHKTEEARAAVGCTYPIQPPHYAGDSPVLRERVKKTKKKPAKGPDPLESCDGCPGFYENGEDLFCMVRNKNIQARYSRCKKRKGIYGDTMESKTPEATT